MLLLFGTSQTINSVFYWKLFSYQQNGFVSHMHCNVSQWKILEKSFEDTLRRNFETVKNKAKKYFYIVREFENRLYCDMSIFEPQRRKKWIEFFLCFMKFYFKQCSSNVYFEFLNYEIDFKS